MKLDREVALVSHPLPWNSVEHAFCFSQVSPLKAAKLSVDLQKAILRGNRQERETNAVSIACIPYPISDARMDRSLLVLRNTAVKIHINILFLMLIRNSDPFSHTSI